MTQLLRRFARTEGGQAAVEFALVLPFLLIMLVGIIEFGRAWNEHQVITDAAREAARKTVVAKAGVTPDSVQNVVKNALRAAGVNPANATVNVSCRAQDGTTYNCPPGNTNDDATVTVSLPYQFTFFGPLVKWTTGNSNITLSTRFTMRVE